MAYKMAVRCFVLYFALLWGCADSSQIDGQARDIHVVTWINKRAPRIVSPGDVVTLDGERFGSTPGAVSFAGAPADASSWSDTQVEFVVPATAEPGRQRFFLSTTEGTSNVVQVQVRGSGEWISLTDAASQRRAALAWTGREVIFGQKFDAKTAAGSTLARYNPITDSWMPIANGNTLATVSQYTWAGKELLVWGRLRCDDGDMPNCDGWAGTAYDPALDRWRPLSNYPKGAPRFAVWTGEVAIHFIGNSKSLEWLAYDPNSDAWTDLGTYDKLGSRDEFTAVWSGEDMYVWGGFEPGTYKALGNGARYNPETKTWIDLPAQDAPEPRFGHVAGWTHKGLLIWGGMSSLRGGAALTDGAIYNPESGWKSISTSGGPSGTYLTTAAVFSPTAMLVVATQLGPYANGGYSLISKEYFYDVAADRWTLLEKMSKDELAHHATVAMPSRNSFFFGGTAGQGIVVSAGADSQPELAVDETPPLSVNAKNHVAVLENGQLLVYSPDLQAGSRFDPVTLRWQPLLNPPESSLTPNHDAVPLFHGQGWYFLGTDRAVAYHPETDSWTSLPSAGAPWPRSGHSVVAAGSRLIVWGGKRPVTAGGELLNTGAIFDIDQQSWSPTATDPIASPRNVHAAVWSGSEMIVWGGPEGGTKGLRYQPEAGTWHALPVTAEPEAIRFHTAVWAGDRMIVWGGASCNDDPYWNSSCNTGAMYIPAEDRWQPITTNGAPANREEHAAVWTGARMFVWGGIFRADDRLDIYRFYNDGALYDPSTDRWTKIPETKGVTAGSKASVGADTQGNLFLIGNGAAFQYLK